MLNFLFLQKQFGNVLSGPLDTLDITQVDRTTAQRRQLGTGGNLDTAQTWQEDGTYQDPVIKLHGCRILKDISQHGGEGQEIIRDPALPHFGEGIVHKASIQPCHKGTCSAGAENEISRVGTGGAPYCTALTQDLGFIPNFFQKHQQRSHSNRQAGRSMSTCSGTTREEVLDSQLPESNEVFSDNVMGSLTVPARPEGKQGREEQAAEWDGSKKHSYLKEQ